MKAKKIKITTKQITEMIINHLKKQKIEKLKRKWLRISAKLYKYEYVAFLERPPTYKPEVK